MKEDMLNRISEVLGRKLQDGVLYDDFVWDLCNEIERLNKRLDHYEKAIIQRDKQIEECDKVIRVLKQAIKVL